MTCLDVQSLLNKSTKVEKVLKSLIDGMNQFIENKGDILSEFEYVGEPD